MSGREELLNNTYGPGSGWERRRLTLTIAIPQRESVPVADAELLVREILDDAAFDITVEPFDIAQHDAEVAGKALRDASVRVSNERHTLSGRLRANAELFALILWHDAEEIEWQQERAARRARATKEGQ